MIEYNTPAGSPDIVFIFLDRTSKCSSNWSREIIKNLSDYVLVNIQNKGFNVIQGLDEDRLLQYAATKYTHAVVLSTGTEFINGDEFFNELEKSVYGDHKFFLMGHIPNRDDGYFELHDQCYIINLHTYTGLGYPQIGEFSYYDSHTQIEPLCSDEHIHDDYTPLWIKPGTQERTYKHKWHGWNILSVALKNKHPLLVFPEQFRNNKKFYYPNYENSFIPASSYLYGKQSVASQTLFYPHNTEEMRNLSFSGPVKQLVIQASGLQWLDYLLKYGYDENTVVRFVDYNLFAVETMMVIVKRWNGLNYPQFITATVGGRAALIGKEAKDWLAISSGLKDINIDPAVWNDVKSKVKFEFKHGDLVLNTALPVSSWVDNVPNTIIHLSHIFNYEPTAAFVPLKHRLYNENLLLKKLKEHVPTAHIIMGRSCEGFTDNTHGSIDIKSLKTPTWRSNGDWL
jgi:hypothetical protein